MLVAVPAGVAKVRSVWTNLKLVAASPSKLMLLGGSIAQRLLVAAALSVSPRAFADHLRLPILIVVITLMWMRKREIL